MPYAILRVAKLKALANVASSLAHTYRTRDTPNANAALATDNTHSAATPEMVLEGLKSRLPAKFRKDAVLGMEYFVGASPEWFKEVSRADQDKYFADAVAWLESKHGKENVVGWSVHRDETSPHLVAYVVPLDDKGKLNAKRWFGNKAQLSAMQTSFAKAVKHHGLERGVEGSRATHTRVKQYYADLEKPVRTVKIPKELLEPKLLEKGIFTSRYETPELVAERLTNSVNRHFASAVEVAKMAQHEKKRADELEATNKALALRLNSLEKRLRPIIDLAEIAKNEFDDLVLIAKKRLQQAKEAIDLAKERKKQEIEIQRRIDNLPKVMKNTGGAPFIFSEIAIEAVKKDGSRVNWRDVESTAIRVAISKGQDPRMVAKAVQLYSPGQVNPANHEHVNEQAMAHYTTQERARLRALPRQADGHERPRGPSLG